MARKRKPINLFGQDIKDGILRLSFIDFQSDKDFLFNRITNHVANAKCKDCKWGITIIEKDNKDSFDVSNRNYLLTISVEYDLVGSTIKRLTKENNFSELPEFKPSQSVANVLIFIYCRK